MRPSLTVIASTLDITTLGYLRALHALGGGAEDEEVVGMAFLEICWVEICSVRPSHPDRFAELLAEVVEVEFEVL